MTGPVDLALASAAPWNEPSTINAQAPGDAHSDYSLERII